MASGCDNLSGWYKSASRRYARFAASLLLFMGSWRHTKGSTEHQCGFDVLEEDEEAPEEDDEEEAEGWLYWGPVCDEEEEEEEEDEEDEEEVNCAPPLRFAASFRKFRKKRSFASLSSVSCSSAFICFMSSRRRVRW